jgi:hypothetical protein
LNEICGAPGRSQGGQVKSLLIHHEGMPNPGLRWFSRHSAKTSKLISCLIKAVKTSPYNSVNKKYRDEFNHKWIDMVILFLFAILATNYRLAREGETPWVSQEKRVNTLPNTELRS